MSTSKKLDMNLKTNQIILRSNASHGFYLLPLLFLAFLCTILRNPAAVQIDYEISTILLLGMTLKSIIFVISCTFDLKNYIVKTFINQLASFITSLVLIYVLQLDIMPSIITTAAVLTIYDAIFRYLLKSLPGSFTYGEATIVVQAVTIFLYNCFLKLPAMNETRTGHEKLNIILQLGILAVSAMVLLTQWISLLRNWICFYIMLVAVICGLCITPIGNQFAVSILWNFLFNDFERVLVIGAYIISLTCAGMAVFWQVKKNQKSNTAIRKIFHVLIVFVYVPGLIYQCFFLYVASVVIFAILVMLEAARIIKLYPVAEALDLGVSAFIDEKDARVALTPLYLLIGCSLPLWIHNSPCDLTDSASHELIILLSGVLSIGIGDTFASWIGYKFGKHKWSNAQKSVEGTLASILCQSLFIFMLNYSNIINFTRLTSIATCGIAIIANALVEALTDQIDNLVLPIITYIILAFS